MSRLGSRLRRSPLSSGTITLAGLMAGAVLGVGATATAVGLGDGDAPPQKQQAWSDAEPGVAPNFDYIGATVAEARPDAGPVADVAQAKTAATGLLEAHTATMAMPENLRERAASVAALRPKREVTLLQVWAPRVAAERSAALLKAIADVATDHSYRAFSKNRFVVTQWQGVIVDGNAATAVLTGHMDFLTREGWHSDPEAQFQLTLHRSAAGVDGWQLVEKTEIVLEMGGN